MIFSLNLCDDFVVQLLEERRMLRLQPLQFSHVRIQSRNSLTRQKILDTVFIKFLVLTSS